MAEELDSFPFPQGPRGRPVEDYEHRLRECPLGNVRLQSGDVARLAVRYDDVVKVLSDQRFSRNLTYEGAPRQADGLDFTVDPDIIMNMDPPRHTRLRRLLAGTLTPRKVEEWRPRVRTMANKMIDGLDGPVVDVVSTVAFPFAVEVISEVMGVPGIDAERIRHWSDLLLPSGGLGIEEQTAALMEFAAYCVELIEQVRHLPGDGVLQTMIQARYEGDRLTDDELVRNTIGMFLAGHETTGSVLSRAFLRLLAPREHYDRLVAEPGLIPSAVEELLRVEVPGDGAPLRVALEDVELASGTIRKGEAVVASFVGPNYDPTIYDAPRELRLDRDEKAHLTFGRGVHFCLGANLARMEMQELIGAFVDRHPDLSLAEDPDEVEWTDSAFKRPSRLLLNLR
ncbi:cytochrome P450 [Amycolatopsis roodepoortensis]|uniref:cytochrome P450 n=1 Tax=Amycolatopsis roodepoortensis TaxID=700274 RepID=UPI00214C60C2|nr:cytochrome P450 [Amycolatopsis roodepoortensis]UUV29025.1 cytochrome P450 [Amycolatopsis roodepoortensis]